MKRIIALIIGLCLLCPLALAESGEDLSGLTNTLETFLKPAEPDAADDSAQADVPAGAIPLIGRIFFSSTANAFGYSVAEGEPYQLLDGSGNAVADFMPVKDFLFNRDGSVVLAKTGDDSFLLFPASSDAPAEAPADAPADDGTCPSCGFDLGGTVYNFCPNCGVPLS